MKHTMRSLLVGGFFFLMSTLVSGAFIEKGTASTDRPILTSGIELSNKRPFSWYYPYKYQYYYPRRHGYDSCYWIYRNGAYYYTCS